MKEIIKTVLDPGTWKISQSDIYTYVNYKVMGTIQSSLMIPNGSSEIIIIKDGKCIISQPIEDFLKPMGFSNIHYVENTDEDIYAVWCDEVCPNDYHTPKILRVTWDVYQDDSNEMQNCIKVIIKL